MTGSLPALREMLDTLAMAAPGDQQVALQVYGEVVEDLGPETALYQGLLESGLMSDVEVEIATAEDAPIRLRHPEDQYDDHTGQPDADLPEWDNPGSPVSDPPTEGETGGNEDTP